MLTSSTPTTTKNRNRHYKLAMNAFGDLSFDEFRAQYIFHPHRRNAKEIANEHKQHNQTFQSLPDSWDWTGKGVVPPVKDQGAQGASEPLVVVDTITVAFAIKNGGTFKQFSVNELTDCVPTQSLSNDYDFVLKNGLCDDYPQNATQCESKQCQKAEFIKGVTDIPKGDESSLMSGVYVGLVAVSVEADKESFQFYSSGVYDDSDCGNNLDHVMSAVGWGSVNGEGYWKLRNSWGSSWGMGGYMLIERNKDLCGVADNAMFPFL